MTGTAEQVHNYLDEEIASLGFVQGQKLPTERQLADKFHVSRTIVRDALIQLEAGGRIVRHVGRGTFVAPAAASSPAQTLPTATPTSPATILEARCVIEGELAALAVLNATEADLDVLARSCEPLPAGASTEAFEAWDKAFHMAIAQATHNSLLVDAYRQVEASRNCADWKKLKAKRHMSRPKRRDEVCGEHLKIVEAIRERDAAGARLETLSHLNCVRRNLVGR